MYRVFPRLAAPAKRPVRASSVSHPVADSRRHGALPWRAPQPWPAHHPRAPPKDPDTPRGPSAKASWIAQHRSSTTSPSRPSTVRTTTPRMACVLTPTGRPAAWRPPSCAGSSVGTSAAGRVGNATTFVHTFGRVFHRCVRAVGIAWLMHCEELNSVVPEGTGTRATEVRE